MQENVKRTLKLGISELTETQITSEIESIQKYMKDYNLGGLELGYYNLLEEELDFRNTIENCPHEDPSEGKWGKICIDCGKKL